jgi:hypothetical protein
LGINTGPLGAGPKDTENFGVPAVYYLGYFGPSANGYAVVGGVQGYPIITRPNSSYDWQEHFTAIKGNHTIKVGGQFQRASTITRRDRARSDLSFYSYGFYYCATGGQCDPAFNGVTQATCCRAQRTAAGPGRGQRPILWRYHASHFPELPRTVRAG